MFGAKAEFERLARRVAGLEAKLDVILQLTAIQMADPALYEQVIRTVMRWREEPAGPQRDGRPGTSPREDGGSAGSGRPEEGAGNAPADGAAGAVHDQLANMMRYAGREQPVDEAGE